MDSPTLEYQTQTRSTSQFPLNTLQVRHYLISNELKLNIVGSRYCLYQGPFIGSNHARMRKYQSRYVTDLAGAFYPGAPLYQAG